MSKIGQLSLITDEISQDFDHVLEIAQQFQIEAVELRTIWEKNIVLMTDEELERMKIALEKRKMKIGAISSPFGKCFLPSTWLSSHEKNSLSRNTDYNLSFFDRIVYIAKYFGTKKIRIFNFLKAGLKITPDRWRQSMEMIHPFINQAEKLGITLMLENESNCFADTIARTTQFFEEFKSPAIKLNLDPGNFASINELTTPEAYEHFYQRRLVEHIHIKDPKFRIPFMGCIFGIVGKGKIDYEKLIEQALSHGYQGYFSLETHTQNNKEEISIESLKYLAEILKKA